MQPSFCCYYWVVQAGPRIETTCGWKLPIEIEDGFFECALVKPRKSRNTLKELKMGKVIGKGSSFCGKAAPLIKKRR